MARTTAYFSNFTAGELSPRLEGRVDIAKYNNGAHMLRNFVVFPHGGAARRPGTYFVQEVKDSSKRVRIIPFEFSVTQAYIIEMGNQYMRFYMNHGRIESPPGTAIEIATPYLEADLFDITFAQSADVLYLAHPNYAPRKLSRSSHTSWTLSAIAFSDGPYMNQNTTPTTMAPSAVSGAGITITASSIVGVNGGVGFRAADVGRLIRIQNGATIGYATITAFTDTTHVLATVGSAFAATTGDIRWRLGQFTGIEPTPDPLGGYPRAVTFFEQRLVWAGTNAFPQTVFGSKSGDFENMAPTSTTATLADDNAFTYTISADEVNTIRHLIGAKVLNILTVGGEFEMSGTNASSGQALTPTNVRTLRDSNFGSAGVKPRLVGNAVLYVQRAALKLMEMQYNFNIDGQASENLTLLSEHITKGGIVDMAWQQEPDRFLWMVRADGVLLGATYDKSQNVVAWHRHPLAWTVAGATVCESVACIPAGPVANDELWLLNRRTIGGVTKRYIEYMMPTSFATQADCFFVDAGLTYSGSPVTNIAGLGHLNGETVQVLGDGAYLGTYVVSAGAITFSPACSKVQVGLGYMSRVQTMRLEAGASDGGTAQGKPKRIHEVTVRFYQTLGGTLGTDATAMDEILFRTSADPMDHPPALYTGDKRQKFPMGFDTDAYIIVEQDQPLPMTILSIMAGVNTFDR